MWIWTIFPVLHYGLHSFHSTSGEWNQAGIRTFKKAFRVRFLEKIKVLGFDPQKYGIWVCLPSILITKKLWLLDGAKLESWYKYLIHQTKISCTVAKPNNITNKICWAQSHFLNVVTVQFDEWSCDQCCRCLWNSTLHQLLLSISSLLQRLMLSFLTLLSAILLDIQISIRLPDFSHVYDPCFPSVDKCFSLLDQIQDQKMIQIGVNFQTRHLYNNAQICWIIRKNFFYFQGFGFSVKWVRFFQKHNLELGSSCQSKGSGVRFGSPISSWSKKSVASPLVLILTKTKCSIWSDFNDVIAVKKRSNLAYYAFMYASCDFYSKLTSNVIIKRLKRH